MSSRFKISTTLPNRSNLSTILGTVSILNTASPSIGLRGPTGAVGSAGPIGPTGPAGSGGGGLTGDVITIVDNTSVLSLVTTATTINNYTQSGLSVTLGIPASSFVKTIALSSGSFTTNIYTLYGTAVLSPGNSIQLSYAGSRWNILTNTGLLIPLQQLSTKLAVTPTNQSLQGSSVALSADGSTLAVGDPEDANNTSNTVIYTRGSNGLYTFQAKLIGTGAIGTTIQQGYSVALSSDGNTLAVGSPSDNSGVGATWVFTRSAGTWTQQGSKLVGTGASGLAGQGNGVSLSSDGNTLAIGGPADNSGVGATWVFTRSAGTWTQQGNKLVGTGNTGISLQGTSVSLSNDGNTVAIGGRADNNNIGATWVFTRSGGVWTQQGNKLVGTGYTAGLVNQGYSVYISGDSNTLAIGGNNDNNGVGATWIFTRSGGVWTQQGDKLVGTYNTSLAQQGNGVALSENGNTLAIGGPGEDDAIGATWIFTRSGGVWTETTKLQGTGGFDPAQGYSVALSSDGGICASGGPSDRDFIPPNNVVRKNIGATWVFV